MNEDTLKDSIVESIAFIMKRRFGIILLREMKETQRTFAGRLPLLSVKHV